MKEEEKEKYSAFITEVSEILGIGKPGDIIKLCIITDNFFKPYQKRVVDLERENELIKSFLYCTERSCNNCGKVNCENFQRQRVDCCGSWVSFKDYISKLETESAELKKKLKEELKTIADKDLSFVARFDALEKENAELKEQVSYLKDNLRVARKDRENLQLEVGKGLQEFIKDCPYTSLKLYANEKYVEENAELKEQIEKMKCCENCINHRFVGDCLECKIIDCNNFEEWELRK